MSPLQDETLAAVSGHSSVAGELLPPAVVTIVRPLLYSLSTKTDKEVEIVKNQAFQDLGQ